MQNTLLRTLLALSLLLAVVPIGLAAVQDDGDFVSDKPPISIAITRFAGEQALHPTLSEIVEADLSRTGVFGTRLESPQAPSFSDLSNRHKSLETLDWKAFGVRWVISGVLQPAAAGSIDARIAVADVERSTRTPLKIVKFELAQGRAVAHHIANAVFAHIVGTPSVFSSHIAYVAREGRNYSLVVADYDGANPQKVLVSPEPIISPALSPDETRIAYVSFEKKKPIVFIRELRKTSRIVLANYKGSNSAPAWSPDGKRLAITLTKDGASQIYLIDADGSNLARITNSPSIDTEPTFAPDGQSIYFTSDRDGTPQIFQLNLRTRDLTRITQGASYAVSPRISPDGTSLSYVQRTSLGYQIAIQNLLTGQSKILSNTLKDESPCFSPDGRLILFATEVNGRKALATVSIDGTTQLMLDDALPNAHAPTWGSLGVALESPPS